MNSESITLKITPEQKTELTAEWKAATGITSCSQYIRAAVNAYSGKNIFS